MQITGVRHDWPEKAGFRIWRPKGYPGYTFLHFSTPMQVVLQGQTLQAQPGACIFYTPDAVQDFSCQIDMIHNWLHADASLGVLLQQYDIPVNTLLYPKTTRFISGLFQKMEAEYFSRHPHKDTLLQGYVQEFLILFSRALQGAQGPKFSREDRVRFGSLRRRMLSSPEENRTVSQMAAEVSLSPSRFYAVYKSLFGTSPRQDLIQARVDYAKSLLLSPEKCTLTVVAERLGYNDQYHFIRQFKAVTGQSPGAYRKRRKGGEI